MIIPLLGASMAGSQTIDPQKWMGFRMLGCLALLALPGYVLQPCLLQWSIIITFLTITSCIRINYIYCILFFAKASLFLTGYLLWKSMNVAVPTFPRSSSKSPWSVTEVCPNYTFLRLLSLWVRKPLNTQKLIGCTFRSLNDLLTSPVFIGKSGRFEA